MQASMPPMGNAGGTTKSNFLSYKKSETAWGLNFSHTVDGRNPAPAGM